jgi:glycosyl transferase family 2
MNIVLNMIVKNEAVGIVQTLDSCKHLIDRWDVLDTGSTDGTQDLIAKCLAGVPGVLHTGPFEDFATTRNKALDLCNGDWALLLNGDDLVTFGTRDMLRAFLRSSNSYEHPATLRHGDIRHEHLRLARPAVCGRYIGVTHEVLIPKRQGKLAPLAIRSGRAGEDRTVRWNLDRALLEAGDQTDPRTVFYLAQTYECLGLRDLAKVTYVRRAGMSGWAEERWEAYVRAGRCGAVELLATAHAERPHRAEPLYWLGKLTGDVQQLRRAAKLPNPRDRGFVDVGIYRELRAYA